MTQHIIRMLLPAVALLGLVGCGKREPGYDTATKRVTLCYDTMDVDWKKVTPPSRTLDRGTDVRMTGGGRYLSPGLYYVELKLDDGKKCWAWREDVYGDVSMVRP